MNPDDFFKWAGKEGPRTCVGLIFLLVVASLSALVGAGILGLILRVLRYLGFP